jgi:hypothetical protein
MWRVLNGSFGFWNRKKASQLGIEKTVRALEANVLCGTDSFASDDKPNLEAGWIGHGTTPDSAKGWPGTSGFHTHGPCLV